MQEHRHTELIRLDIGSGGWLQGQWSYSEPRPDFAVLFLHGFCSVRYGGKSQAIEECCVRRGWPFAAFDFRGHGESSGTIRDLRGSTLLADLASIQRHLATKGVERLFLVGSSMGGWASAWFSLQNPGLVEASALIAPGFHFLTARWERLSEAERDAWEREGILRFKNQWIEAELSYDLFRESRDFPIERLHEEYRTPTLIFQGMDDDVVPYQRTLDFIARSNNRALDLLLIKNGDHRLLDQRHRMADLACRFFGNHLTDSDRCTTMSNEGGQLH